MRRVALLFPGQGMEVPRMGLAVAERHAGARALLERAAAVTETPLTRLLDRGGRPLERTEILQPTLTAVSLGAALALRDAGVVPDFVAGHSLGEVAAWSLAGGPTPDAAVALAGERGRLMAAQARVEPGGMLAIRGSAAVVDAALSWGRRIGPLDIACENAPDEWVVSGAREALRAVADRFPSRHVAAAGPWHSRTMRPAAEPWSRILGEVVPTRPVASFVSNHTADCAAAEDIPEHLIRQISSPVRWRGVLRRLSAAGVRDFVTAGPGRMLRAWVRVNLGDDARVHAAEDPDDFAVTASALASVSECR